MRGKPHTIGALAAIAVLVLRHGLVPPMTTVTAPDPVVTLPLALGQPQAIVRLGIAGPCVFGRNPLVRRVEIFLGGALSA